MRRTNKRYNINSVNNNHNNIVNISSGGSRYSYRWTVD